ncbi:MAG: hypothetical protein IJ164_07950 [Duodenibacillus sp.]|nr:hypothetical protein [Duodenibacillus sp.]
MDLSEWGALAPGLSLRSFPDGAPLWLIGRSGKYKSASFAFSYVRRAKALPPAEAGSLERIAHKRKTN